MDFQRVLAQSQSYLENAPKKSDATKQILEQGENFQKTMAGERGIMAGIEAAHLRPKIQKYIRSKLNTLSSDDVLKGTRNIGTRLNGVASKLSGRPTGELPAPVEAAPVSRNLVLAPRPSESGLVQEGGFSSLAPGRGIAERFGGQETPALAASRLTRNLDATNNPLNPLRAENVGQSESVPELDLPEELPGLSGAAAISSKVFSEPERVPATTSEQIASLSKSVAARAAPEVSPVDIPESTERTGALAGIGGRTPTIRTSTEEPSLGPAPSLLSAPAPEEEEAGAAEVEAQAMGVASAAEARAIPKGGSARGPAPEDFPSPPSSVSRAVQGGEEEASGLLSSIGSGFRSVLGAAGTAAEGLGIVSAFTQKGLTGQQRAGQIAQTLAPRAAGKVGQTIDEYGLPKAAEQGAEEAAETAAKAAAKATAKTTAEKIGGQVAKEGAIAGEEAEVPGIGDILAIGTALFGGIRAGIEAAKAKKEAEDYTPPPNPVVAMDNAVSFDSSFR